MNGWQYSPLWSEDELLNGGYSGFVYMFYFPDSGQVYIGSKQIYKRIKEAKKIKPDSKENDWRDYSSSSNLVNQKIENGERYVRTVLWAFPSMRETLLVESVLITSQILKPNCLNLALMNKIRAPNAANKAQLFGIVQNILEWID